MLHKELKENGGGMPITPPHIQIRNSSSDKSFECARISNVLKFQ